MRIRVQKSRLSGKWIVCWPQFWPQFIKSFDSWSEAVSEVVEVLEFHRAWRRERSTRRFKAPSGVSDCE